MGNTWAVPLPNSIFLLCFAFQVNKLLAMLQEELQKFVLRMAAEFPNRKEQLIFLINNYDMMLAVLKVRLKTYCNRSALYRYC